MPETKQIYESIALAIAILSVLSLVFFLASHFRLTHDQQKLLDDIQASARDHAGRVPFEALNRDDPWDTVCVVPQHAFSKFLTEGRARLPLYFGEDYRLSWISTPDPSSMHYGIGFSFLERGRLTRFIQIPVGEYDVYGGRRLLPIRLLSVTVPGQAALHFSDLDVQFQPHDRRCYPRTSGYMQILNANTVAIRSDQ